MFENSFSRHVLVDLEDMDMVEKYWTTGMLSLRDNSVKEVDLDGDAVNQHFGYSKQVTDEIDFRGQVGDGSGCKGSVNSNCIKSFLTRTIFHFRHS